MALVDHNRNMALVDHNRNMTLVDHNRNMTLVDHKINMTLVDHNRNMALVDHNRNMTLVDHNRNLTLVDLNTPNHLSSHKEYIYCVYGTENRKEEPFSTHEHKQSLRTLFVQLSLQMIQVHALLTDPVVQSVTRLVESDPWERSARHNTSVCRRTPF